jgi:hypothetical protein
MEKAPLVFSCQRFIDIEKTSPWFCGNGKYSGATVQQGLYEIQ